MLLKGAKLLLLLLEIENGTNETNLDEESVEMRRRIIELMNTSQDRPPTNMKRLDRNKINEIAQNVSIIIGPERQLKHSMVLERQRCWQRENYNEGTKAEKY